jgi:hypothetical protein
MWEEWYLEEECPDTKLCDIYIYTCYTPNPPEVIDNHPIENCIESDRVCYENKHIYIIRDCNQDSSSGKIEYIGTCEKHCYESGPSALCS